MARITHHGDEEWNVPEPEPLMVPVEAPPVEVPTEAPGDPGEVPAPVTPVPEKVEPHHVPA